MVANYIIHILPHMLHVVCASVLMQPVMTRIHMLFMFMSLHDDVINALTVKSLHIHTCAHTVYTSMAGHM